jgi:Xaa-Pro aminopeptidase
MVMTCFPWLDKNGEHRLCTSMKAPSPYAVYAQRRARLAAALRAAGGGVALLGTASLPLRNGDSEHAYRHASAFFHLTGFAEPNAWLVLRADGHCVLFCQPRDEAREIWDGVRLGPEAATARLGADEAWPVTALDERMPALLAGQDAVWLPFASAAAEGSHVARWLEALRGRTREGLAAPTQQRDLQPLVDEMRLVKDAHELSLMRRAGAISAQAHARAMQFCARTLRGGAAGVAEHEIEAELLHEFRRHGAAGPAYTPIVAAGANACVLHYVAGSAELGLAAAAAELRRGELCLIDAGCEYGSYAADVTRTFPADGRFTPAQRALYELVVAAQQAAVAATRPGARKQDAHWAAVRVLAQGMLDVGLLKRDAHGSLDDVIDTAAYRRFFMHGTGHWLGLDVHDAGEYLARDEAPVEQPDGYGGRVVKHPSRKLVPGMVLTIEPGLYVRPADDVPREFWNIGIRIEDDAVVTDAGCELITRGVPVDAGEIERLMAD